ncbi:hypothetical protein HA402_002779 [Bradysia odoriphaga]|nr:hypothetical protein HA402_002779 [Bradysia odoriphaga]
MFLKFLLLICGFVPLGTSGEIMPSLDTEAVMHLAPTLNSVNLLDGPSCVSHASTTPTTNSQPTLTEMEYYTYYAAAMYCQYELNDLSCTPCQKFKSDVYDHTVIMNNETDNTAIVAVSKTREEIVVAFRGTMNIWNVVLDVATIACTYPNLPQGVKLHAGFHAATMSLYQDVVTNVGYLRSCFPSYKIVITGQSLGGAIARLTQFYLLALNQFPGAKYECYTYGEPRSGNEAFANFMNSQTIKTVRVVNNADIVTHVAPTSLLGTTLLGDYYVHCQPEYWYVDENNQRFCDTTVYEDPTCSDSLGPDYSIADHSTYLGVNYAPCLFGQPAPWAAIPFNIFQPVGTIPPMPGFIYNFNAAAANFAIVALDFMGF